MLFSFVFPKAKSLLYVLQHGVRFPSAKTPRIRSSQAKLWINGLKSEILRVANFVYSSKNLDDFKDSELSKICKIHEIDLDSVIQENIEKDKRCDYEWN